MPSSNLKPHKKKNKMNNPTLSLFLKIQIFSAIVYISLFLIFNLIAVSVDLANENVFFASLALFSISSFVVGFASGIKIRQKGLITGVLYALPMNLTVILISAVFNGFSVDLRTLVSFVLMVITSAVGGILSVNTRLKK